MGGRNDHELYDNRWFIDVIHHPRWQRMPVNGGDNVIYFLVQPVFKLAEIIVHSGGNLLTLRFIYSNGEFHWLQSRFDPVTKRLLAKLTENYGSPTCHLSVAESCLQWFLLGLTIFFNLKTKRKNLRQVLVDCLGNETKAHVFSFLASSPFMLCLEINLLELRLFNYMCAQDKAHAFPTFSVAVCCSKSNDRLKNDMIIG